MNSADQPAPDPITAEQRTAALDAMLQRHATILAEHFDSVQIICTRVEPDGGSRRLDRGSGDRYARHGAVRSWLHLDLQEITGAPDDE